MKNLKKSIVIVCMIVSLFIVAGCSNFLEVTPKGILVEELLSDVENVEGFVTAAYSLMPQQGYTFSFNPWIHGSFRSDDTYKGGGGLSDLTDWHNMEIFAPVTENIGLNDNPWYLGYCAVSRMNTALNVLDNVDESSFPNKNIRIGEVRFLRGMMYFEMKQVWKWIPWCDETIEQSSANYEKIPNRPPGAINDLGLWGNILDDFKAACNLLPETQPDLGRVDKNAALAMAAKTLLFMAYEQNDAHQVVNINKQTLEEALTYLNQITNQERERVDLCVDIAENFMYEYDNETKESIYEIQHSINDGTTSDRTNWGNSLTAPWWSPYFTCCDFHKVSYNLVNAFRTGTDGLPMFDTFNDEELQNNYYNYFGNNTFDPRIGHTVAIPGLPWKYETSIPWDSTGSRSPYQYGYLNSKKEQVEPTCPCISNRQRNSMNRRVIRYAEVLLWKAECLIQLDRHAEALPLINKLRERAGNSTGRLKKADNRDITLNYNIALYENGVNCTWTKEFAWKALQWENRLETACEGRRFFDLQRWGILEPTMNAYFAKEKTRWNWMDGALFTAGRDEYRPIPRAQLDWAKGSYTQNPGY